MKKVVKIVNVVLIIAILLCICTGCFEKEEELHTKYFTYFYSVDAIKEQYVVISGLTDAGKEQKYLVIPEEIDGLEVRRVNAYFGDAKFEKMYFHKNIYGYIQKGYIDVVKLIFIRNECPGVQYLSYVPIYYSEYADDRYESRFRGAEMANVTYLLNYRYNDNNGIYFVDDLEEGESIAILPEEPTREGYEFKGWYLEKECTTKVTLETFVYKEEMGNVTFYAAWEKK